MIAREYYVNALEQLGALPEGQANWWYGGIAACNSADILDGTKVGNQHESTGEWGSEVNVAMSRYDMAQVMYNLLRDQGAALPSEADQTKAQAKIGDWSSVPANYQDAVAVCYALGLLNGQSDGTFGGQNNMNRAQACVVIDRLNQYIEDGTVNTGSDDVDDTTPPSDTDVEEPEEQETETPATTGTLANGKAATEENVHAMLDELKEKYPDGSTWGTNDRWSSPVMGNGRECAGYAFMVSDKIFGNLPKRKIDVQDIRPGDVIDIRTENGENFHWAIATSTVQDDGFISVTSGNVNGSVRWDSWYDTDIENGYWNVYTRYPD